MSLASEALVWKMCHFDVGHRRCKAKRKNARPKIKTKAMIEFIFVIIPQSGWIVDDFHKISFKKNKHEWEMGARQMRWISKVRRTKCRLKWCLEYTRPMDLMCLVHFQTVLEWIDVRFDDCSACNEMEKEKRLINGTWQRLWHNDTNAAPFFSLRFRSTEIFFCSWTAIPFECFALSITSKTKPRLGLRRRHSNSN